MRVTKYGHCCLLIEEAGVCILTDPGNLSTGQNNAEGVDVVLITHDHADHLHAESLHAVLRNNPKAKIVTNRSVGALLEKDGINSTIVEDGQEFVEQGVRIEGIGKEHATIDPSLPPQQNTGYFIADRLFFPGDAFTDPQRKVDVLALPVAGPWMKLSEAIQYAFSLHPQCCFPVHEGILKSPGSTHRVPSSVLEPQGIRFLILEEGRAYDL